jgi:hypothetical protein
MTDVKSNRRFDGITCPDCDGPIFECKDGPLLFECLVGHRYAPETMREEHNKKLENALWSATVALEEHATVLHRIAEDRHAFRTADEVKGLMNEARQKLAQAIELRAFIEKVCGEIRLNKPDLP